MQRRGAMAAAPKGEKKNKKARIHQESGPLVREVKKTRLHVLPSRMSAGIAITVHPRLRPEALKLGHERNLADDHRGGRAGRRISARGAGRNRR
jgi:hypothetical protein